MTKFEYETFRALVINTRPGHTSADTVLGKNMDTLVQWVEQYSKRDAASGLLAVLHRVKSGDNCWCDCAIGHPLRAEHDGVCKEVRAAIAKAEGK